MVATKRKTIKSRIESDVHLRKISDLKWEIKCLKKLLDANNVRTANDHAVVAKIAETMIDVRARDWATVLEIAAFRCTEEKWDGPRVAQLLTWCAQQLRKFPSGNAAAE